jgi:putative acetyltransferase
MDIAIRPERPDDLDDIRRVQAVAFGARGPVVADLVDSLRAMPAGLAPVSLVAVAPGAGREGRRGRQGEQLVGHVLLTASRLDAPARLVDVYVLSPLGVLPEYQRQGIGTALVRHALDAGRAAAPLVFLEGDPAYYGKRGFERAVDLGFRKPSLRIPDEGFQVARMPGHEPWMTGTLVYAEPFWAHDCVGLRAA